MGDNGAKKVWGEDDLVCGNCLFCHDVIMEDTKQPHPKMGICRSEPPRIVGLTEIQQEMETVVKPGQHQKKVLFQSIPSTLFPGRIFVEKACGAFIHYARMTTYLEEIKKSREAETAKRFIGVAGQKEMESGT